jgi:hypothetical protein
VPSGVVAHTDDIVLPVSWRTVDERSQNCHISVSCNTSLRDAKFILDSRNYDGNTFATALAAELNIAVVGFEPLPTFICTYDNLENILVISMTDVRSEAVEALYPIRLQILTDDTLT